MMMEPSHYLTTEVLKDANYPEVKRVQADIEALFTYMMTADTAVIDFNDSTRDRIDLNPVDIIREINRCRSVCSVLGNAPRVCFDLLVELRQAQENLQELLYLKRRFGDEYISAPSEIDDSIYGAEGGIG